MSNGKVTAVIGGQFGSEGKGVIVNHIAREYDVHVRTGGPNAGHSFYHGDRLFKMQGIPCGWTNPDAALIIGRGGLVSPEVLRRELLTVAEVDAAIWSRLKVDGGAGVLDSGHREQEGGTRGELHSRIGSTGEGVGAARIARIRREAEHFDHFRDIAGFWGMTGLVQEGTPTWLATIIRSGYSVLLEGTQGHALSLIHGTWPYVTSADTGTATLLADAGIAPRLLTDVLLVIRTFPIRVAGNSGPLKAETTWEDLSRRLGRPVEERTTVTNKVRRVGEWDEEIVRQAITVNGPTAIALMFLDYLNPADEGVTEFRKLSAPSRGFIDYVTDAFGVPVRYVGTGGPRWSVVDVPQ